jgi:hypothetical protein
MTSYDEWTSEQDRVTVPVDDHDLEVAYRDEGTGDPVVFVHGLPTNSYLFHAQFDAVADRRRAVVVDMVGYGNSAMWDGFDRSIRAQEAAIRGLIDELGFGTVDVEGHNTPGDPRGSVPRHPCRRRPRRGVPRGDDGPVGL